MIKEKSFKIFLSNGITLTVKGNEKIIINGVGGNTFKDLYDLIEKAINDKTNVKFEVEIDHEYKSEDKTPKTLHQNVRHKYFIPSEKITWYMIEEV